MKTLTWQRLMPLALMPLLFLAACGSQQPAAEAPAPTDTPEPAPTAVPTATAVPEETSAEPAFTVNHYLLSYTPGENWADGKSLLEQDIAAHTEYMQGLLADGRLVLGGPVANEDRGLYVIAVTDAAEVDAILAHDPGVVDGLFATAVTPWFVVFDASVNTN